METNSNKWIPYLRVSTDDKGQTVEQQLRAIEEAATRHGIELINANYRGKTYFYDEKSGSLSAEDREGLRSAIKLARKSRASIICAKTDRLTRSYTVAEVLAKDTSVSFKFLNAPDSALYDQTQRMIFFGFVAEGWKQGISLAVKAKMPSIAEALARANELYSEGKSIEEIMMLEPLAANTILNGKYEPGKWRLGTPVPPTNAAAAAAGRTRAADKNEKSIKAKEDLAEWLKHNPRNLSAAARYLNSIGRSTPRGGDFTPQAVKNLIKRFSL